MRCIARIYFHPQGGRPGILSPKGVAIDHKEFPADWFQGLRPEQYRGRRYDKSLNKYGVRCIFIAWLCFGPMLTVLTAPLH